MNEHYITITKAILKGLAAAAGETYDKAIETGIQVYSTEIIQTISQKLAVLYYILATRMDELEAFANKRWIEKYHKTILCPCKTCDTKNVWQTKQLRELKRSWM